MLRFRVNEQLSERTERLARHRGCDLSDVAREALLTFVSGEEERLGIGLAGSKAPKSGKQRRKR